MAGEYFFSKRIFDFIYRGKGHSQKSKDMAEEDIEFGILAERWLGNVRFRVKESSYVKYYNLVNNHIIPSLGSIAISEFTTGVVETFIEEKLRNGKRNGEGGLSEKTVKDILCVLKEISSFAVCQNMNLPVHLELIKIRVRESETLVMDSREQITLERYLMNSKDLISTGILLSMYMGLRIGEVCALKRENILIDAGILQVRRTMQRIQIFDNNKKSGNEYKCENSQKMKNKTKIIVTEPKSSAAVRDIPIPDFLMERLKVLEQMGGQAYILTGKLDEYIEPRTLENKFKAILKKCGLKAVNYHVLRHTFATRCIENGFDVKSLSEILGHANVNITLNRYVHSSMAQKRKNMEKVRIEPYSWL